VPVRVSGRLRQPSESELCIVIVSGERSQNGNRIPRSVGTYTSKTSLRIDYSGSSVKGGSTLRRRSATFGPTGPKRTRSTFTPPSQRQHSKSGASVCDEPEIMSTVRRFARVLNSSPAPANTTIASTTCATTRPLPILSLSLPLFLEPAEPPSACFKAGVNRRLRLEMPAQCQKEFR